MAITTTVFHGLSYDLLVEEFNDRDGGGRLNGYLAAIYTVNRMTSARNLVRKSRLPGAAESMRREIERDGIRAFRRFTPA